MKLPKPAIMRLSQFQSVNYQNNGNTKENMLERGKHESGDGDKGVAEKGKQALHYIYGSRQGRF